MKLLENMIIDVSNFMDNVPQKLATAQRETAKDILKDTIEFAPSKSGDYISSIKISDTNITNQNIKTMVYTDLTSDGHAVGRMIEYGTGIYALEPHIGHTKTFFSSGYQYWYVPTTSVKRAIGKAIKINGQEFYIVYAQPSKPHFVPALQKNVANYKQKTKDALKEAMK